MRCTEKDIDKVHKILGSEDIFKAINGYDPADDFKEHILKILGNEKCYILMPHVDCAFIFTPMNTVAYEGHSQVLLQSRGRAAFKACKEALEYMFTMTPCRKIIGFTPVCFPAAHAFNRYMGFRTEGLSQESFKRQDVLYDQTVFGMTKDQWFKRKGG